MPRATTTASRPRIRLAHKAPLTPRFIKPFFRDFARRWRTAKMGNPAALGSIVVALKRRTPRRRQGTLNGGVAPTFRRATEIGLAISVHGACGDRLHRDRNWPCPRTSDSGTSHAVPLCPAATVGATPPDSAGSADGLTRRPPSRLKGTQACPPTLS
jgi:hypothetical protein